MKKIFLFLATLILLFNSCKKDFFYNTTVTGIVTDEKTGSPLPNIVVDLQEIIIFGYGKDRGDPIVIKTAVTNANGEYTFKYKSSKKKKVNKGIINFFENNIVYALSIKDSRYYSFTKDVYDVENRKKSVFSNNRGYEANASLIPLTYIKYKYKNILPYNDNDELFIVNAFQDITYFKIKGGNVEGITEPIVCEINNVNELTDYRVFWKVSGNLTTFKQIVYCPIGDTTIVEINY